MSKARLRVPEGYLKDEKERVNRLTERSKEAEKDQKAVDEIYEEVVGLMKQCWVEESVQRSRRGQPWFSKELAQLRKSSIGPKGSG